MTPWILAVLGLWVVQTFLPPTIRLGASSYSPAEAMKYGLGARDEAPPMPVVGERAARALSNLSEALPVFLGLALLIEARGIESPLAHYGAGGFLLMRALYVPAYLSGVPGIRSTLWMASWGGLATMIYALLT